MAAHLIVNRITGTAGAPVYTPFTGGVARISTSDNPAPGIENALAVPNPGQFTRSYWLSLQLETLEAPDTLLNNVRISTDGSVVWPGVEAKIALASDYVQATGVEGVSGTLLNMANHSELLFEPVPIQNYTEAAPLVLEASTSSAEKFGEIIVVQITGTNQAISGTLPPEFLQIRWDET